MQKNPRILVTVVAAAAFLVALAGVTTAQRPGPAPVTMGVVDVAKVYISLAERNQIEAELEMLRDKVKQEDQVRLDKINEMREDLRMAQAGSEIFDKKRADLEMEVLTLQAWQEFQKRRMNAEQTVQKEKLYKRIIDAIGDYAQANEYDMVLYKESTVNFRNVPQKQVDALIALRKVLWSKEELDITESVVAKMNNEFNAAVN